MKMKIREKQPETLELLPWVPTHAHEKKARDDFSASAVPLNQQKARRKPDCEMLNEKMLMTLLTEW
jgi:hypothetical protein